MKMTSTTRLSVEAIRQYREDGYLIPEYQLSES